MGVPLSRGVVSLLLLAAVGGAAAQGTGTAPGGGGIYSCVDDQGRRLTSDRPIPECTAKEQRVLNRDGSLKAVVPPSLTAEQRAQRDAEERRRADERAAAADAARRDRNLLTRFPDEAAHSKARDKALAPVRAAVLASEDRLRKLAQERKPLESEKEFYVGKPLPVKLISDLQSNDSAIAAQHQAIANQRAELDRLNRMYDGELERLRKLWAGAAPGSLGPVSTQQVSAGAAAPVTTAR